MGRLIERGLLSELLLLRLHGRSEAYLGAPAEERGRLVEACRAEATLPDLPARILKQSVYAQCSTRAAPVRELLQNALDASPRGATIDVLISDDGARLAVVDGGCGMSRERILRDLLVPYRSAKHGDPETIGEHGIGFLSTLDIAARVTVVTSTGLSAHRVVLVGIGAGPPYPDFTWTLEPLPPAPRGTRVELELLRPCTRHALAPELGAYVGHVDPARASIRLDGREINTRLAQLRRVATAEVALHGARRPVELSLYVGQGDGHLPRLTVTQRGLLVCYRQSPFFGPARRMHAEVWRAVTGSGMGFVCDLPAAVSLNKGRSAVAAEHAPAVEAAFAAAFERFILNDALFDRALLRVMDHRLGTVLDRLLQGAIEEGPGEEEAPCDGEAATQREPLAATAAAALAPGAAGVDRFEEFRRRAEQAGVSVPTIAIPEQVTDFAARLLDSPALWLYVLAPTGDEERRRGTLRTATWAFRRGRLLPRATPLHPEAVHLDLHDPLAAALWRRLHEGLPALSGVGPAALAPAAPCASLPQLHRTDRATLLELSQALPGASLVAAALEILEHIDAAVSAPSGLPRSQLAVHQGLFGAHELAHTDGQGISLNLLAPRVRDLLGRLFRAADLEAFTSLVELVVHEKTHVALASYRSAAEHGTSFYQRKERIRARFVEALSAGAVSDPWPAVRAVIERAPRAALPEPLELAAAVRAKFELSQPVAQPGAERALPSPADAGAGAPPRVGGPGGPR